MVTTDSSSFPSNKGEEIVVGDVVYVSSEEEEDTTKWLHVLLQTKFWWSCNDHWKEHRGEMSMLCLYCYEVVCPHCMHDKPGHRLLKVRRYAYRSIILVKDIHDLGLNIDISEIQTYIVNSQRAVHLRPVRRSPGFRPSQGAPSCTTCSVWLHTEPNLFCSLACKENVAISGDFSDTEADRKARQQASVEPSPERTVSAVLALPAPRPYASPVKDQRNTDVPEAVRGYGVQKPVADSPSPQQPEAPPAPVAEDQHQVANNPASFRRRPRKMLNPVRAPFF
uniref:Uncharacterized protein n=1 Tax=Avena sativa TaxID=4498 RepID=A0ACD5XDN7_AVESA